MQKITTLIGLALLCVSAQTQQFYFGNDLSYVNQMEDCGAVYKEKMQPKDPFRIFADHGTNLVRVRLWNDPSWWQDSLKQPEGVKKHYNDFDDVRKTIRRAKQNGMQVMLDIHLSDFWADPSHQVVPKSWLSVARNDSLLADSVYQFVKQILIRLRNDTLMPEIVKVGNESNPGMMIHTTLNNDYSAGGLINYSWTRQSKLFNAAFRAIREVGNQSYINPKICLHYAGLKNLPDWYQNVINYGITDFDIIGFSYYYAWHGYSIKALGDAVRNLRKKFPQYQVMAVETGYIWTTANFDAMPNIITTPDPQYLPVCPEKQLEYMVDYTRAVMKAGGIGVIFWEPAWVSTPCRTPWGIGSSHDHLAFFDPVNTNFMENGGGRWTEPIFYQNIDSSFKTTFKVSYNISTSKSYLWISMLGAEKIVPMIAHGNSTFSYATWLKQGDTIRYTFLSDSSFVAKESLIDSCGYNIRQYIVEAKDTILFFPFGSCRPIVPKTKSKVTFKVDMTGQDVTRGVFITGTLNNWVFSRMTPESNMIYSYTANLHIGDTIVYYFIRNNSWTNYQNYREKVPSACAKAWGTDRQLIVPDNDTIIKHVFGSCDSVRTQVHNLRTTQWEVIPNPSNGKFVLKSNNTSFNICSVEIFSLLGKKIKEFEPNIYELDISDLPSQVYLIKISTRQGIFFRKILLTKS
ncbi:MAG: glycosyl hydrolase 53 family protein [Bacteroidales bacterium]|nr:glycosyl hydrolase 53 family protein [Bacteroidales bacterium]